MECNEEFHEKKRLVPVFSLGNSLRGYYMFSTEISLSDACERDTSGGKTSGAIVRLLEAVVSSGAPLFSPPMFSLSRSPFPRPLSFATKKYDRFTAVPHSYSWSAAAVAAFCKY